MKKIGCAAIALAIASAAGPASAAPKVVWDWAIYGPPRALTKQIEAVSKYVAEKSNGNFTFNLHYAESISPAKSVLDGLKIEAFQGALIAYGYAPGKVPLHLALDLPYLPVAQLDIQHRVIDEFNTWEPANKELSRWNTYSLYTALLPVYEFMGSGTAPKTLESWKGMRVRALGPLGDAMRTLGAVPTSVPAPEVYNALERGTFEAASFPFSYSFGTYRLYEVSKWYTMGLQLGIVNNSWGVAKTAYDKLPAEYRKILEDAKSIGYVAVKEAYAEEDKKWIPTFDKAGLERITISPAMQEQYREKAGKPVWAKWVEENKAKGLPAQEAVDLILQLAKKYENAKGS